MEVSYSGGGRQSSSPAVAYICGLVRIGPDLKLAWYGVDVEGSQMMKGGGKSRSNKIRKKNKKVALQFSTRARPMRRLILVRKKLLEKIDRFKLNTVAMFMEYGFQGSCTIIGEHVYWFGDNERQQTRDLFKHDINDPFTWNWDILSPTPDLFCLGAPSVLAPFGRKLYVLLGKCMDKQNSNPWGAIYDLDSNTWENLECNISAPVGSYSAPYVAFAEHKKEILFYNLREGSILFYSLTSGEWHLDQNHPSLALWDPCRLAPPGLEDCYFGLLYRATSIGSALLSNDTLYWFTSDLRLYGYDIDLKKWFPSPYLGKQLPTLKNLDAHYEKYSPFLIDMHNGKFLVIVPEVPGEITVASLIVSRNENSLSVTVESFHPLSVDPSFYPIAEMSMLKNSRAGSMHGPVRSTSAA